MRAAKRSAWMLLLLLGGCGSGDGREASGTEESHEEGEHHPGEHADEVHLAPEAIARHGVAVEKAQLRRLQPTFVAPARVGFNTEAMAHVGSPVRGRAIDIKVRLGTTVKPGDELLVVESPELGEAQSDFLTKRTAVETAAPPVELAKTAWDRAKGLYESSQGISLTEVQRREAEYKVAVAQQKAAQAAALAAENRLHLLGMAQDAVEALAASGEVVPRLTIRAPIAGEVVEREITLGELVGPEREALLVLADMAAPWILAHVPEARLRDVALGAAAWVKVGALDAPRHEGTVTFVSPTVDPATRTTEVRIEVRDMGAALRPGMFAQAEICATGPPGADPVPVVAVPEAAVQTVEGGPAVFVPVPDEENTFAKRAVQVGRAVAGLVPVYSGLAEGEPYVASGSFILKAELGKASAAHEH